MDNEEATYVAVWDIETQNRIDEMPGQYRNDKIKLLPISCASIVKISAVREAG